MFSGEYNGIKIELPFINNAEFIRSSEKVKYGCIQSDGFVGGFEKGAWEPCEIDKITRFLPRDIDVIEFGAGSGYTACFTNKLLEGKRHIVFEANPLLIPVIENNRDINGCNFEVVGKAYAFGKSSIDYHVTNPVDNIVSLMYPVVFKVDAVSLSDVLEEYKLDDWYSIIMDIEGYEFDIVNEAKALEKCKLFIIEIHTPGAEAGHRGFDNSADVKGFLEGLGFVLKDNCGCPNRNYVYERPV